MADWNKKYWYTFRDTENTKFTVEIWEDIPEDDPLPFPAEVRADASPAILNYNAESLFTPVRGSGVELTLLSVFDQMFSSLYTPNMMKYQVRIYKTVQVTPIYSVEKPVWFGYLDSENYREPFESLTDYPVSVTAADGFNLLSRINYIEYNSVLDTYSKYSGLNTMWGVLMRVIQKLNLPWANIYVGLSTTIPEVTLKADETILHRLYVNNENYYNEDGEPETCRTVLESLLKIFGAYIIQLNGDLYITDSHHIASGTTAAFKKYAYGFETTSYLTTANIVIDNGDISALKPQTSKITMEVEPGINKQVVSYSPYNVDAPLDFKPEEDFSGIGTEETFGTIPFNWKETSRETSESWTKHNSGEFINMVGLDGNNVSIKEDYLKITNAGLIGGGITSQEGANSSTLSFTYKKPLPFLIPSQSYRLKISCEIYVRTVDDLNNPDAPPTVGVALALLQCRLKIGGKKYHRGFYQWDKGWVDASDTRDLTLSFYEPRSFLYDPAPINDYWYKLAVVYYVWYSGGVDVRKEEGYLISIKPDEIDGGLMEFNIYGYRVYDKDFAELIVKDFRIRNLSLSIIDAQGNEVNNSDVEYISKLDARYNNAGNDVRTYHGTNIDGYPIQRGNLMLLAEGAYLPINGLNKAGDTDIPEKLLLRSIKSNYGGANVRLSIDLPALYGVGYVTYDNHLPGKKLAILSNRIDLAENVSGVTLREVHTDTATIL